MSSSKSSVNSGESSSGQKSSVKLSRNSHPLNKESKKESASNSVGSQSSRDKVNPASENSSSKKLKSSRGNSQIGNPIRNEIRFINAMRFGNSGNTHFYVEFSHSYLNWELSLIIITPLSPRANYLCTYLIRWSTNIKIISQW